MYKKSKVCSAAMLALAGTAVVGVSPAQAQQQLDRVEITGSSIRRLSSETALPVTVIKVEELNKLGITTTEQAVARIASNQASVGASSSIGGTTGGKAEVDLRGLSGPNNTNANKTLVLLNGRRLANHAFDAAAVDLNAIPLSAIDRIEVLRDGASAIYGTDAIGGVVNFITRREVSGIEISAEAIAPEAGAGGATKRLSLSGGFGSLSEQRFNVMGALDWRKQKVLLAKDRQFSKTGILGPTKDDLTSGTSGTAFPGDLNGVEATGPACAPPNSLPRNTNPDNTGAFDSCRYDFSRDVDLLTQNEQITGLIRGTFAFSPDHTVSLEYLRAHNKSTAQVAPAPTSTLIPSTSPYFIPGVPTRQVIVPGFAGGDGVTTTAGGSANWRQVPAGKRTSGDDTTTERTVLEFQGLFANWDYRAALGTSQNKSTADVKRGYVNDDIIAEGVWNGVINPFGPQTAAGAAAIEAAQVVSPTQIGKSKVDFGDVKFSNPELFNLPAGPVGLALGLEARIEKSTLEALPITATLGSLGIDPDSDTTGKRNVGAAFAEFSIPIVKSLEMTLAGRFDRYNDFGNTFNPKVALRYQPIKQVLLRGSASTGFRAPTLYEVYQPQQLSFTTDNYDDPLLCPGGTPVAGADAGVVCGQQVLKRDVGPVGNGQAVNTLKPEKSKSFTLGFVVEPDPSLTLGVDFWRTSIKNMISGLPEQEVFDSSTKYAGRFVRCSQLPQTGGSLAQDAIDACISAAGAPYDPIGYIDTPTENLGRLRTQGIDISMAWRSNVTEIGSFGAGIDGTFLTKYEYQHEVGGRFINALGRYSDNAPVFRWQHVATGSWSMGSWGATVSHRYKSGYVDQDGVRQVPDYGVYDISATWTGVKGLTVTAGINNVFDDEPPVTGQSTTFQRGYDPRFTDPIGRAYVLRLGYKF